MVHVMLCVDDVTVVYNESKRWTSLALVVRDSPTVVNGCRVILNYVHRLLSRWFQSLYCQVIFKHWTDYWISILICSCFNWHKESWTIFLWFGVKRHQYATLSYVTKVNKIKYTASIVYNILTRDYRLQTTKLHGRMHYKIGVTCVNNGHVFYTCRNLTWQSSPPISKFSRMCNEFTSINVLMLMPVS